MRIGILTFHNAHNYGAMLQCFALQQFLTNEGYAVEVIDYKPSYYQKQYASHPILPYIGKNPLRTLKSLYYNVFLHNRRCSAFNKFHREFIHCSYPLCENHIPSTYDVYVVGSDQIWNTELTAGFDDTFFCNFSFPKGNKRYISYAPSMEKHVLLEKEKDYLRERFLAFDAISVRESSAIPLLQPLTKLKIEQVIDPTLLVDKSVWNIIEDKKLINHPYVILYQIREDVNVRRRAEEFAGKIKGDVVELTARIDKNYSTKYQCASPADFINLFRHADFVMTTSFHGTAFSIIFNRPFYTFMLGDNYDSRSLSLLKSLNISHRFVSPEEPIEMSAVSYESVNVNLQKYRKESIDFLLSALLK